MWSQSELVSTVHVLTGKIGKAREGVLLLCSISPMADICIFLDVLWCKCMCVINANSGSWLVHCRQSDMASVSETQGMRAVTLPVWLSSPVCPHSNRLTALSWPFFLFIGGPRWVSQCAQCAQWAAALSSLERPLGRCVQCISLLQKACFPDTAQFVSVSILTLRLNIDTGQSSEWVSEWVRVCLSKSDCGLVYDNADAGKHFFSFQRMLGRACISRKRRCCCFSSTTFAY